MQAPFDRGGVTYIGPRAFIAGFAAVCAILVAVAYGASRLTETAGDTPAPLAVAVAPSVPAQATAAPARSAAFPRRTAPVRAKAVAAAAGPRLAHAKPNAAIAGAPLPSVQIRRPGPPTNRPAARSAVSSRRVAPPTARAAHRSSLSPPAAALRRPAPKPAVRLTVKSSPSSTVAASSAGDLLVRTSAAAGLPGGGALEPRRAAASSMLVTGVPEPAPTADVRQSSPPP